jgi:hypothetical protein
LLLLDHRSSGTPIEAFGSAVYLRADSASNTLRNQFVIEAEWIDATDATRKSKVEFFVSDTSNRRFLVADAMGTGSQVEITLQGNVNSTGKLTSDDPSSGVGYADGAGGAVTQGTNRTTGVTLNKICGAITLVSAAGSTTWQSFTVTNSVVEATDVVHVCQKSGTDLYETHVTAVAAGSFRVTYRTTGGTTTEQPVFNFTIIKAVAS